MRKALWPLVALLALPFAACGGEDSGPCDASGDDRPFGECCTEDAQCSGGVCHEYGDGTVACSVPCGSDADCPEGSQGKKCNNKGICRV